MRRMLMTALLSAAVTTLPTAPAHAALTLVATFSGNQCTGGPITTCYAPTLTQVGANGAPVPGGTPGIGSFGPGTVTTATFTDSISTDPLTGHHILTFNYTGTEVATYLGIFQGGSGLNCSDCNNTYQLFSNGGAAITSGTIDLNTYFTNNGAISHVDLFDHGALPEPATWAMMLFGFAGIGMAMRRRQSGRLPQIA